MQVEVRGPFRITDNAGVSRTPKGAKERALLALLLLSPGQRRTRAWLQDKLWSTRSAEQSAVSFRQALANVRKALGPLSSRLGSDRSALWIDPMIAVPLTGLATGSDLLDDIDVDDPEFENWLRDLRQQSASQDHPKPGRQTVPLMIDFASDQPRHTVPQPIVAIVHRRPAQSARGQFLARALADKISNGLQISGDLVILLEEGLLPGQVPGSAEVIIEIETLEEDENWYVLLRTLAKQGKRCVWTGRLQVAMNMAQVWDSAEVMEFANRCAASAANLIGAVHRASGYSAIHRAVRRIYDFDRVGLEAADALLRGAQDSDFSGLALAWRGFIGLTAVLEFRDDSADRRNQAMAHSEEALRLARHNSVVLALASQVQQKLVGDLDYGRHLAKQAVVSDGFNPYALDSLSQSQMFCGEYQKGHATAELARRVSTGLMNGSNFEMLSCLAELGIGRLEEARLLALSCHRKKPISRPSLRYLVALNLLADRHDEAAHYVARLRLLEPDFTTKLLLTPEYPVETLRNLGLADQLRGRI